MKLFRPPRATLADVRSIVGTKALRVEHRLCDAMFHIAQHSRSVREHTLRAKAEQKVVLDLEEAVRTQLRPTQRAWKWERSQRLGLAKQIFGSTFNSSYFENLVKYRSQELMLLTMYRVSEQLANAISNISEHDPRDVWINWTFYSVAMGRHCTKKDTNTVGRVAGTCRTVGYAVFGDFKRDLRC